MGDIMDKKVIAASWLCISTVYYIYILLFKYEFVLDNMLIFDRIFFYVFIIINSLSLWFLCKE
jgi:hypothetical protein